MEYWWAYLALGLSAGVLGSMLGVGGGILMVPALYYLLKMDFKTAAAMSLAVMIPMTLTATLLNLARPEVKLSLAPVVLVAAAAVGGAFLGTELAKVLPVLTLRRIFAVIMVVAAVYMAFFKRPGQPAAAEAGRAAAQTRPGPAE